MDKLQRSVDSSFLNESKDRTMNAVMDRVHQQSERHSILRRVLRPVLIPTFILVLALVVIFAPHQGTPGEPPVVLSAAQSKTLAEISYLSSTLIVANITVDNINVIQLSTATTTQFEENTQQINVYFDMLRVFLEDNPFDQAVVVTNLENSEYDQLLEFELNGTTYDFYITIVDQNITGELQVGGKTFTVTGTIEDGDGEYSVHLDAVSGNDYVSIEYNSETNTDNEIKYQVQTRMNGIESQKQIKISQEDTEAKVEIEDNDNHYQLKKEIENGVTNYKLEYTINGVSGEAKITESTDTTGVVTYSYLVKEGDVEKEINEHKPDYGYNEDPDSDNEESENPGVGNNDDNPGVGNSDDSTVENPNQSESSDTTEIPDSTAGSTTQSTDTTEDDTQTDTSNSSDNSQNESTPLIETNIIISM